MKKFKLEQEQFNDEYYYLYQRNTATQRYDYVCLVRIKNISNTKTHHHIECEIIIHERNIKIIKKEKKK